MYDTNHQDLCTLYQASKEVFKSVGTTSPESARRSTAKYAAKNKDKLRAKWTVQSKVRSGEIKKPSSCPNCGKQANLQFHHNSGHDKSNHTKGVWRCRQCHVKTDPKLRKGSKH